MSPQEQNEIPAPRCGYRAPTACATAGITYRQLDYWARTGLVEPSVSAAGGSGSQRLYSWNDILRLRLVSRFLAAGLSLPKVRAAIVELERRTPGDLASVTLFSDGLTVYEATDPEQILDLLKGGQVVMGVALGPLVDEVSLSLSEAPVFDLDDQPLPATAGADELAARRRRSA